MMTWHFEKRRRSAPAINNCLTAAGSSATPGKITEGAVVSSLCTFYAQERNVPYSVVQSG